MGEARPRPGPLRPSFLRTESNRRWTVAVAEVPDELFVEELDRLRRMGMRAGEVHGAGIGGYGYGSDFGNDEDPVEKARAPAHYEPDGAAQPLPGTLSEAEDDSEWVNARRAMLCCRELVRTERSYLARLQQLIDGDVRHPCYHILASDTDFSCLLRHCNLPHLSYVNIFRPSSPRPKRSAHNLMRIRPRGASLAPYSPLKRSSKPRWSPGAGSSATSSPADPNGRGSR